MNGHSEISAPSKPLLRGHFHQAAFFMALGACLMLITRAQGLRVFMATLVYSLSLVGLFGISALYHRPQWRPQARMWMKRLDHSAIFVVIAGTSTPLCLLALQGVAGNQLLSLMWIAAALGILQSLFWVKAPRWFSSMIYVGVGLLALPFGGAFRASLSTNSFVLLFLGGILYAIGAVIYAIKRPNPYPRVFGYHEIFHLLVVVASAFHFLVIARLVS